MKKSDASESDEIEVDYGYEKSPPPSPLDSQLDAESSGEGGGTFQEVRKYGAWVKVQAWFFRKYVVICL